MSWLIPRFALALLMGLSFATLSVIIGCTTPQLADPTYPPDLSMVVTVIPGRYAGSADPARSPAHYVVESDLSLRVARGPGVHHRLYPPMTAQLRPAEMARLYAIVTDHTLTDTANTASNGQAPTYQIEITADGQTTRYHTTPDASPGSAELVRQLAAFHQPGT